MKNELKLGPLPKTEAIRTSIALSRPLKDALDLYASDFGELHGTPADIADLIPHMLEAFLRSDKAFMKRHADSVRAQAANVPAPLPSATAISQRAEALRGDLKKS